MIASRLMNWLICATNSTSGQTQPGAHHLAVDVSEEEAIVLCGGRKITGKFGSSSTVYGVVETGLAQLSLLSMADIILGRESVILDPGKRKKHAEVRLLVLALKGKGCLPI